MRAEQSNDMINKYLEAETTLEEEKELFDTCERQSGIGAWTTFAKREKIQPPANLKDSVRAAIRTKKRKRQRMLVPVSIAASIALLVTVFLNIPGNRESEYLEKEAQLREALSLFSADEGVRESQQVIYEDEMLIIYMASN